MEGYTEFIGDIINPWIEFEHRPNGSLLHPRPFLDQGGHRGKGRYLFYHLLGKTKGRGQICIRIGIDGQDLLAPLGQNAGHHPCQGRLSCASLARNSNFQEKVSFTEMDEMKNTDTYFTFTSLFVNDMGCGMGR